MKNGSQTALSKGHHTMLTDSEDDEKKITTGSNSKLIDIAGLGEEHDIPIVVIKIGTSTVMRERPTDQGAPVTNAKNVSEAAGYSLQKNEGEIAISTLALLTDTILTLKRGGFGVILVTSGAVGMGCRELGFAQRPPGLSAKQALAAVGQVRLMATYAELFRLAHQHVAQVLLARTDFVQKHQYFNARDTLLELVKMGVVPIVNENDTVATEELRFGDNDSLSAFVAGLVSAKWLFLLTDVDMLYTDNPRTNPEAKPIPIVQNLDDLHVGFGMEGKGGTQWGTGGMVTKIIAGRLATAAGVTVCVSHGRHPERILDFVMHRGTPLGTVFLARPDRFQIKKGRKRWIAQGLLSHGHLFIDDGAVKALRNKKSLFAAGIKKIEGEFESDNSVTIYDLNGKEVARGITNFSTDELGKIMGHRSEDISEILNYNAPDEVIHRHNLVVFKYEE